MSFFYDVLNVFDISDLNNELIVSLVVGVGVRIFGDVLMESFSDNEIILKYNKKSYKCFGSDLKIKSISRGEIFIKGNVVGFVEGGYESRCSS